ncbi:MAG: glycine betaine/L-proline ABC transporter substrate-binding protein ProX [Xenococcaceae cyanobacterium]
MSAQPSRKLILVTALAALLTGLIACQPAPQSTENNRSPGQGVSIRSAHSNWIEEYFQTEIVNIGLEKLGYQVESPKELDYPALYISIANGDLDYSTVYYDPGHKQFFDNAGGEEKLQTVGILTPKGIQGYQIDKKTAEKYNISNLEQLQDPEIAKLFDSDGDGKANLVGCNPGWSCELAIDHQIEVYGLQDTVEHARGNYTALLADAITRYNQGQSIIFYAYNPHWIFAVLKSDEDVVWLEVPFTSLPETMGNITENDTVVNGKNFGLPTSQQRIVANRKFLASNPVAKRWFELVQIPVEDMNAESLRIKNGENRLKDIRGHAQEWVTQNQAQFDSWLEQAREASQ